MNNRVLLLVEGQDEFVFFQRLGHVAFGEKLLEIVTLRCNIYSLFKLMEDYDFDIDLEKAIMCSPNCPEEDKIRVSNTLFPYKYLIFDFDFQEESMAENEKINAIEKMVNIFNDESDNGMLLINYPMFESIREKYENRRFETIKFNPLNHESYKAIIDERGNKIDCDKLDRKQFLELAETSLCMSNYIIKGKYERPKKQEKELTKTLFEKQKEELTKKGAIYCVNTSAQFPCFYFGLKILK